MDFLLPLHHSKMAAIRKSLNRELFWCRNWTKKMDYPAENYRVTFIHFLCGIVVKVKYLRGVIHVTKFSMPWIQALALYRWAPHPLSTSIVHVQCVAMRWGSFHSFIIRTYVPWADSRYSIEEIQGCECSTSRTFTQKPRCVWVPWGSTSCWICN